MNQAALAHQKNFVDTSDNAVKTQICCVMANYGLINVVKKQVCHNAARYTCPQLLLVSAFEKTQLSCAVQSDEPQIDQLSNTNQLILFNF